LELLWSLDVGAWCFFIHLSFELRHFPLRSSIAAPPSAGKIRRGFAGNQCQIILTRRVSGMLQLIE
jgi:hypothetical protein